MLSKRTMDFKVSYLDAGFATSYFDSDTNSSNSSSGGGGTTASGGGPKLNHRRYKTQLRDFLSSCRTKRKPLANELYGDTSGFAAAAAAGYPTAATMYSSVAAGTIPGYPGTADSTALYMQQNLTAPAYQSLYPGVDNRYLAATDYFTAAGYRSLSSYYPDYATHAALGNGYLDVTGSSRIHSLAYDGKLSEADKLYGSSAAAAAYMSAAGGDPRLCGSLRLPTPMHDSDSKHGKDTKDHLTMLGESGKIMVKEEGLTNTEYLLPSHHTAAASTLADQLSVSSAYSLDHLGGGGPNTAAAAVLYMCPPATMSHSINNHHGSSSHHHPPQSDSPNSNYDPRGHVHSPGLRLATAIAAGGGNSPSPVGGGGGPHSHSGEAGTSPSCMDNCTTLQTTSSSSYCTLSLSELCGHGGHMGAGPGQGGHTNTTVSIQAQEVTS